MAGVAEPLVAGVTEAGDAVVAEPVPGVPGVVMAVLGSERAGLADAPPDDGPGTPEGSDDVPAHPAVAVRPSMTAAITAGTAISGRRSGLAVARHLTPNRYHATAGATGVRGP